MAAASRNGLADYNGLAPFAAFAHNNPGAGLLIGEGGVPQLVKVAYLSDEAWAAIADYATAIRRLHRPDPVAASSPAPVEAA